MSHTSHFPSSFYPRDRKPGHLAVEASIGAAVIEQLRQRGHVVEEAAEWSVGRLTAASRDPDGLLHGGHAAPDAGLRHRSLSGGIAGRRARRACRACRHARPARIRRGARRRVAVVRRHTLSLPHDASPESPTAGAQSLTGQEPLFIVLNTGSGRGDAQVLQETIRRVLDEAGRRHELMPVDDPSRLADTRAQQSGAPAPKTALSWARAATARSTRWPPRCWGRACRSASCRRAPSIISAGATAFPRKPRSPCAAAARAGPAGAGRAAQ